MIPTIGRIVHFNDAHGGNFLTTAAIITKVNPTGTVDLAVFAPENLYYQSNVPFTDHGEYGSWNWPPIVVAKREG